MTRPKLTIDEDGERAVSPVIGVILMVAITVILAAVIGTFVLDLGQNVQNTGPSASMGFSDAENVYSDTPGGDMIEIEHQSGEALDADSIRIVVRQVSDNSIVAEWDGSAGTPAVTGAFTLNGASMVGTNTVNVGDVIIVGNGDGSDTGDHTVTVVSLDTDNRIATGTVEVV